MATDRSVAGDERETPSRLDADSITENCQLTKTGVSDNAGGVKYFSTTPPHALEEERHFALIGEVLSPTKGSLPNQYSGQKLSSTHASLRSQARS